MGKRAGQEPIWPYVTQSEHVDLMAFHRRPGRAGGTHTREVRQAGKRTSERAG